MYLLVKYVVRHPDNYQGGSGEVIAHQQLIKTKSVIDDDKIKSVIECRTNQGEYEWYTFSIISKTILDVIEA